MGRQNFQQTWQAQRYLFWKVFNWQREISEASFEEIQLMSYYMPLDRINLELSPKIILWFAGFCIFCGGLFRCENVGGCFINSLSFFASWRQYTLATQILFDCSWWRTTFHLPLTTWRTKPEIIRASAFDCISRPKRYKLGRSNFRYGKAFLCASYFPARSQWFIELSCPFLTGNLLHFLDEVITWNFKASLLNTNPDQIMKSWTESL